MRSALFFRACKGLAATALVVTDDKLLVGRLTTQAERRDLVVRFARSGYESAILLDSFHPSLVVLDSGLPEVRDGRLTESMRRDERLLGVRLAVAVRRGDNVRGAEEAVLVRMPLTVEKMERLVEPPAGRGAAGGGL